MRRSLPGAAPRGAAASHYWRMAVDAAALAKIGLAG